MDNNKLRAENERLRVLVKKVFCNLICQGRYGGIFDVENLWKNSTFKRELEGGDEHAEG